MRLWLYFALFAAVWVVFVTVLGDEIRDKASQLGLIASAVDIAATTQAGIIESPQANRVFQQEAGGVVDLRATWRGQMDSFELKQGSTQVATSLDGRFLSVPAGWYDLNLIVAGELADTIKVGVGDVYLLALSQSNGVSPLQPDTFVPITPPAGRVILSDYYAKGFNSFRDPATDPLIADHANGLYVAGVAWIYAGLALNRSYPVMFVNMAEGNTTAEEWANNYVVRAFDGIALYKPKAMLSFIGESDSVAANSQATVFTWLNAVVGSARQVSIIPWVVALNSQYPVYQPVRDAQQQLITTWSHVHLGPDTDAIRTSGANLEFVGSELQTVGEAWAARLLALNL